MVFVYFCGSGGQKIYQKSIKIVSQIKLARRHPEVCQKMPNMTSKWVQVGAMLGSKTILDVAKSEEKATENDIKKPTPKRRGVVTWPGGPVLRCDERVPKVRLGPGFQVYIDRRPVERCSSRAR